MFYSSFNHMSLVRIKELAPDAFCGALQGRNLGNAGYYCRQFGFQAYHPGVKDLTEETVKSCRDNGIQVNVWTVNDMGDLEKMEQWGCDGVITNYPSVCKSWADRRRQNV